ncbi:MAG: hypothetical protein AAGJ81_04585 [Verrucomicrobiota bacterium]
MKHHLLLILSCIISSGVFAGTPFTVFTPGEYDISIDLKLNDDFEEIRNKKHTDHRADSVEWRESIIQSKLKLSCTGEMTPSNHNPTGSAEFIAVKEEKESWEYGVWRIHFSGGEDVVGYSSHFGRDAVGGSPFPEKYVVSYHFIGKIESDSEGFKKNSDRLKGKAVLMMNSVIIAEGSFSLIRK